MNYSEALQMLKRANDGPTYELKRGQNPALLDKRFGFAPGTIANLNPGLDYTKLQIGQKLKMPSTWRAPSYHTIAKGDTMQGLDKRYGLPYGSFQKANPGLDYKRLQIGQRVEIPMRPVADPNREPFKGPSPNTVIGPLMQESLNGRELRGDIRDGYAYAIGPLGIKQVWPSQRAKYLERRGNKPKTYIPVIDDVNDRYKTSYTAEDRNNLEASIDMFNKYLTLYGRIFYNKHGRNPTDQEYWRMWNGGPSGYMKDSTKDYVKEVKAKLANPSKWGLTPGVMYTEDKK